MAPSTAKRTKTQSRAPMKVKKVTKRKATYRPSKPQASKKDLLRITRSVAAIARRRFKPHIVRERPGCVGLVLGQAPPGPRSSLPRGWRPLAGPAEQRLAKLAGLPGPAELWAEFDRANLLSWYPGLKERSAKHSVAAGYGLHQSDGDVFPMADARKAAGTVDLDRYACVLLLGSGVARAFGVKAGLLEAERRGGCRLIAFPHPSGVSHFWNEPANVQRAAKVLKSSLRWMRRGRDGGRAKGQ
mmetsp:Transcript_103173/g.300900  ORF Transcript_103173/g.300900 Transcript_103173/m.300900 type:complete len:243 (+) Transcript_103173:58-786(+)